MVERGKRDEKKKMRREEESGVGMKRDGPDLSLNLKRKEAPKGTTTKKRGSYFLVSSLSRPYSDNRESESGKKEEKKME